MKITTAVFVALIGAGGAFASPMGVLGIGSSGTIDATLTSIFFTPDPSATGTCTPAPCNGDVNSATTLTFDSGSTLTTNEGILINQGNAIGAPPPAGAGFFNPFLTFDANPDLVFNVSGVGAGSSNTNCIGLANGDSCSLLVAGTPSPVTLQLLNGNTIASISFFGVASDSMGSSNWQGGFSATIPGVTPADILHDLCGMDNVCSAADAQAGTQLVLRSVSGSFTATASPVPEPGTISLLLSGIGFVALGLINKRRAASRKA